MKYYIVISWMGDGNTLEWVFTDFRKAYEWFSEEVNDGEVLKAVMYSGEVNEKYGFVQEKDILFRGRNGKIESREP